VPDDSVVISSGVATLFDGWKQKYLTMKMVEDIIFSVPFFASAAR
jgi:hypothetical protein